MESLNKRRIINCVKRSIKESKFSFEVQPVFCTQSMKFSEAELLLRLHDAEYGNISPSEFIPLAEENNIIADIDYLVVQHGLELLEQLQYNSDLEHLHINLSPISLLNERSANKLMDLLQSKQNVSPRLCIELTETAIISDFQTILPYLEQIAQLGISLAVDDFGSGQSSLIRWMDGPFNVVKFDKKIVDRSGTLRSNKIIEEIIHALDRLRIKVIAEGIETAEQMGDLKSCGCCYFQGYYLCKPLAEDIWKAKTDEGSLIYGSVEQLFQMPVR